MLLLLTPLVTVSYIVTFSLSQDVSDLGDFAFLPCTSILFHTEYKAVMVSLVGNLLLLSPVSYFLAYPRDTNSFLHFPVTIVG